MMEHELLKKAQEKMDKTLEKLKKELMGIRAGRANPQLLDKITVDYYGTPTPIHQLGNISAPEPRMLVISLWDAKLIGEVEKAILKSDLGLNPSNDGRIIRLILPQLTEERRKELTKLVKKLGEEAKVAVRAVRRDTLENFQKLKKNSEITEDDLRIYEKEIQKLTDNAVKGVDTLIEEKAKEIMHV